MPRFLTTKLALAAIEQIIDGARERLVILSPYQRMGEDYRRRIVAAAGRGVDVYLVYGDQNGGVNAILEMGERKNIRVVHVSGLHAKCYYNEAGMVITSLNLLQSSETNWEMGVWVDAAEQVYANAVREAGLIISAGQRTSTSDGKSLPTRARELQPQGFCIRCRGKVPLDPVMPLCGACYGSWSRYWNPEYAERYCHQCGNEEVTSLARPRCWGCYTGSAVGIAIV